MLDDTAATTTRRLATHSFCAFLCHGRVSRQAIPRSFERFPVLYCYGSIYPCFYRYAMSVSARSRRCLSVQRSVSRFRRMSAIPASSSISLRERRSTASGFRFLIVAMCLISSLDCRRERRWLYIFLTLEGRAGKGGEWGV